MGNPTPSVNKKEAHNSIPHTVSQARDWVSGLPLGNSGEVTKRLYKALILLNQQPLPSQVRIDIGDVFLPFVNMSLDNLDRHFSSRSFPLLERSQKVFDLKQALQLELAGLYQLATLDMLTKGPLIKKKLLVSIGRSIKYMSGTLINSYSVYNKNKANVWHDVHQLYLFACENEVESLPVPDKSDAAAERFTIEEYYLFAQLVALSVPNSLRQGEIHRVEKFYRKFISKVRILENTDTVKGDYAHIALLNSDEPAALMPISDIVSSPTSRIIDTSLIIALLNDFVESSVHQPLRLGKDYPMLNHSLAKRLVRVLTSASSRKHKRFERNEKAAFAIRLKDVIEVVSHTQEEPDGVLQAEEDDFYAQLNQATDIASQWVDLGVETLAEEHNVEIQTWMVENSSASGYGICQEEKETTAVRIGELVGIRDPADESNQWQILVIRWMDYYRGKKGFCFGAELLSPKAMSIRIDDVENRAITQTLPVEGLFLPSIEGLREAPNLILPGHMFKVEDILNLRFISRDEKVQITKIDECVGVFAYCSFKVVEATEPDEDEENFEDVWSFL